MRPGATRVREPVRTMLVRIELVRDAVRPMPICPCGHLRRRQLGRVNCARDRLRFGGCGVDGPEGTAPGGSASRVGLPPEPSQAKAARSQRDGVRAWLVEVSEGDVGRVENGLDGRAHSVLGADEPVLVLHPSAYDCRFGPRGRKRPSHGYPPTQT